MQFLNHIPVFCIKALHKSWTKPKFAVKECSAWAYRFQNCKHILLAGLGELDWFSNWISQKFEYRLSNVELLNSSGSFFIAHFEKSPFTKG